MPIETTIPWLLIGIAVGVVTGIAIGRASLQKRLGELSTTLDLERQRHSDDFKRLEQTFAALSGDALRNNNEAFLQLAKQTLEQFNTQARGDLDVRKQAVEGLVKPIKEALERTEQQVRMMESERKQSYGALSQHLETLKETQQLLHGETRNLVQALRRPEVRGQWGELTLRRLVELAGMVEHCDFYEQPSTDTEDGRRRPDMVVRLPAGREIVVDVKTPLDAYVSAIEAKDDATRRMFLEQHARHVRERIKELAAKAYWNQFKNAPDFIILFIPGDQFLGAALDVDHNLIEEALRQKVILTTPTSLVALLRAVAYGWRQETLAENASRIRDLGEELYQRLTTFSEHLARLGRSLVSAVTDYNKTVGSYEAKVLPAARRFPEMGIPEGKAIEPPEPIEKVVREVHED